MAGQTYPKSNWSPKLKRYNKKYKPLQLYARPAKAEKVYTPKEVEMMRDTNGKYPRAEVKFESMPSFKASELRRKKK